MEGMYAFLAEGPDGMEFILNALVGGNEQPLMSRDAADLMRFRAIVDAFVKRDGMTVRFVHFSARRDLDTIRPSKPPPALKPPVPEKPAGHDPECRVDPSGRCAPCLARLDAGVRAIYEYLSSAKAKIREAGSICRLCEAAAADPAVAKLVGELALRPIESGRQDFLASLQTLLALFREKLGVAEFPETDRAVRLYLAKKDLETGGRP